MPDRAVSRIILIVLDSLGIGSAPDAGKYGDLGADTLGNLARSVGGLCLPNLESLGLGYLGRFTGIGRPEKPLGSFMRLTPSSAGKDTTTGHWELAGLVLEKAFPTFPGGFPENLISDFENRIGSKVLGNYPASGTEIINKLGEEHLETGAPIVYTSADSVFQVAAHNGVIPLERLYEICQIARGLLRVPHNVARVIARPFAGEAGAFYRTPDRRDFSLLPPKDTVLDKLCRADIPVAGVGKIPEIFGRRGISLPVHSKSNAEGVNKTVELIRNMESGLIFTNLVEFDMLYGHRRDPAGYAEALREFDRRLPSIMGAMRKGDLLMITADHGCDPTFKGTDHTREEVPLLMYSKNYLPESSVGGTFSEVSRIISRCLLQD